MCDIASDSQQFVLAGNSFADVFRHDNFIPIVAIAFGSVVAVVAVVMTSLRAIFVSRAREATKRELAAYVAEGTMEPDKAVAMINAGRSISECEKET